jgi:hypothetical protein
MSTDDLILVLFFVSMIAVALVITVLEDESPNDDDWDDLP